MIILLDFKKDIRDYRLYLFINLLLDIRPEDSLEVLLPGLVPPYRRVLPASEAPEIPARRHVLRLYIDALSIDTVVVPTRRTVRTATGLAVTGGG